MTKRTMVGIAALALAAGAMAIPTKAHAHIWWLWPAASAASDAVLGASDQGSYGYNSYDDDDDDDRSPAYDNVGPAERCHPGREQMPDGNWRRVRVCEY